MSGRGTIFVGGRSWALRALLNDTGGFGEVWIAESDGHTAAIKLVEKVAGARREWLLANELRGLPNIMPVLDVAETQDSLALLMPLAAKSLRQHVGEAGRSLTAGEVRPILIDIAGALVGMKSRGVVHRDIKPENILLYGGAWCLTDFGVSRYAAAATATATRKRSFTWQYAAPEQWRHETATSATDVYAFGVMAHELLAGVRPFRGLDDEELRRQHLHDPPPPIPGISTALATLIDRCLIKASQARDTPQDILACLLTRDGEEPRRGITALLEEDRKIFGARAERARLQSISQSSRAVSTELAKAAREQYYEISDALKRTIMEATNTATLTYHSWVSEAVGWIVALGHAELEFSDLLGGSGGTPNRLSFDIVQSAYVLVDDKDAPNAYRGRAHSLWFCDVEEPGCYRWYELGFAGGDPGRRLLFHSRYKSRSGIFRPYSMTPTIMSDEMLVEHHQVVGAWPFARVEIDEFVDRWIQWFAEASRGVLSPPPVKRGKHYR